MLGRWVIIFMLSFLVGFDLSSQSAICAYNYRKRITIDPTRVAGPNDFTNFPVLISIPSDNNLRTLVNGGRVQNSSGFDIVFTADDGVTRLDFQLERYVATSGLFTAWVKVPVLSTSRNTYLYMYYGNTAIATDQSTVSVWSGYQGVWHLQNGSFTDNSGNARNYTNNGTTNQSPAIINDGRSNSGVNWLELSSFPNLTTNFSMSAWVFTSDNTKSGQRVFCDDTNNSGGYALSIGDAGTGSLRFFSRASNPVTLDTPNNTILNNTWYHVVGVADITNQRRTIYVNGVAIVTGTFTNAWGVDVGNATAAGENASGETGNRLQGRIDELRVASSALTASWVATEYNNQSSPSTFYSISTEPNVFNLNVNVNWTSNGNWSSGSAPSASVDVILSASATQPNLNTDYQANSIWVRPNTTLTIGNGRTLSVLMDVTNCGVINAGNASSELEMNANASSTPTQYISGTGTYSLSDFIINSTNTLNPAVVLSSSVNVSSDLTLTSGLLVTSSVNILALGSGAASSAGSAASYVSGPMSKLGTSAFVFPVGKGGRWRRIGISAPSSSTNFRAEYFNSAFTSTSPVNAPLDNVSSVEYWQLDQLSGAGNASVTLFWESASGSGINNCADLTIARWNGTGWDERPGTFVSGSSCAGAGVGSIITNTLITAFSPFTFGSKSGGLNPLPIELVQFTVSCLSAGAEFSWSTLSEHNNAFFKLEFSTDGLSWRSVAQIGGSGTTSRPSDYTYLLSEAEIGYYRLSQVDFDLTEKKFQTLYLDCKVPLINTFDLIPNPSSQNVKLNFSFSKNYGPATITITDLLGNVIYSQNFMAQEGNSEFRIQHDFVPGSYYVKVQGEQLGLPVKKLLVE